MSEVFVFGSNEAGRHGAGSAKAALRHGAVYGIGRGRVGNSYAIPTKDRNLRTRPLEDIRRDVDEFLEHARAWRQDTFRCVAIGCGLAGYAPEEIAPMFADRPSNVTLPPEFEELL